MCACYSPYRPTTAGGASNRKRIFRIKNRSRDPYSERLVQLGGKDGVSAQFAAHPCVALAPCLPPPNPVLNWFWFGFELEPKTEKPRFLAPQGVRGGRNQAPPLSPLVNHFAWLFKDLGLPLFNRPTSRRHMTLPPTVSESVRYHAARACSDIVGRIYSCAKPIYFNCLFPTIIKRILTRIVTRYIL